MSSLIAWIHSNDALVHVSESIDPVASSNERNTKSNSDVDRSIVARAAIPAEQTLVTLHSDAVLSGSAWLSALGAPPSTTSSAPNTSGVVATTPAARALYDELQQRQLSPTVLLALALLHECALGEQSRFAGYIAQLPAHIPLPLTWSKPMRFKLQHTAAAPSIDAELVANVFATSIAPLAPLLTALWPSLPAATAVATSKLSFDRFAWAYTVVSSRAFRLGESSAPVLLPVIDMANHAASDPAAAIVKTPDGAFALVARRSIAKDDAVTISYGDLSNAELLCRYGFVLPASVPTDALLVQSNELLATFAAFKNNDVDNSDDESDSDAAAASRNEQQAPPPSKKRRVFRERSSAAADSDNDVLFFHLHGDATRDFGLGDALLSFVFAKSLPAEVLYDVLAVLLRKRDKRYSRMLEQTEAALADASSSSTESAIELALLQLLVKHERAVCRRILIGILTLEENSSDEEVESGDEEVESDDE